MSLQLLLLLLLSLLILWRGSDPVDRQDLILGGIVRVEGETNGR